ncbi:carbamoyltransferase family protein [Rhodovibrionaceae bacterium A322]
MTYVLGLNAYHGDASACLLKDGVLLSAVEEERFRRIKHWAGFPSQSIAYCLEEAGIALSDVAHVAINRDPGAAFWRKVAYTLTKRPSWSLVRKRLQNRKSWLGVDQALATAFPGQSFSGQIHQIEHHQAHLASAFLASPFDEAVTLSVDGFGDFASAAWGLGKGNQVTLDKRVYFPHSLGIFYQALTQFLGFPNYGDEYKVMGLSAYGKPAYLDKMRQIVRLENDGGFSLTLTYFRHHREDIAYEWDGGIPSVASIFAPALAELLGPARRKEDKLEQQHFDLAASVQAMYEETLFHMLDHSHRLYGCDALALAGGCGFNSLANGRILKRSAFKRLYVQSAAGDAGGAIGAALETWHGLPESKTAERPVMDHAYFGPSAKEEDIRILLESRQEELAAAGCDVRRIEDEGALCQEVAQAISEGLVIGWFQGRMEWGPRALGNRSILGDPRRADMKDILNLKIKRRESFRPFAPSVLEEKAPDWFEDPDQVPFMMKVYPIKEEKRPLIPAVTHVDGTGRLQTVSAKTNPLYHQLISAYEKLTEVPMVLNTSFNENEPVVCRPEEALDCFLRTKMDVLALGPWLVRRQA